MEGLSEDPLENEQNTTVARGELSEKGLKFLFNVYTDYNLYDYSTDVDRGVAVASAQHSHNSGLIGLMRQQYGQDAVVRGESYPPGMPFTEGVYVKTEAYAAAHGYTLNRFRNKAS